MFDIVFVNVMFVRRSQNFYFNILIELYTRANIATHRRQAVSRHERDKINREYGLVPWPLMNSISNQQVVSVNLCYDVTMYAMLQ